MAPLPTAQPETAASFARLWDLDLNQAAHLVAQEDALAAAELLRHHLKADALAAVIHRPATALGGLSLHDLAAAGDGARLRAACQKMFDFGAGGAGG